MTKLEPKEFETSKQMPNAITLQAYAVVGKTPVYMLINPANGKAPVFLVEGKTADEALNTLAEKYWNYKLQHPGLCMGIEYINTECISIDWKSRTLSKDEQAKLENFLRTTFPIARDKLEQESSNYSRGEQK